MKREFLSFKHWQEKSARHIKRMRTWTRAFVERRRLGKSHPIDDFLFIYYRFSPAKLETWHPGTGVELELSDPACSKEQFESRFYSCHRNRLYCDESKIGSKDLKRLNWIAALLRATAARRANFCCHGMHEWAMVYGGQEIRHEKTTPLRLPQIEIDELVESRPIACSHFDAFRFFADKARPLNVLQPTLHTRIDLEQPACVHANMDLYKWSFKSMPWVGSEFLRECFELAMMARKVDMQASPYDLKEFGLAPIKIETREGRAQYEQEQRRLAELAAPLRDRLAAKLEIIVDSTKKHAIAFEGAPESSPEKC